MTCERYWREGIVLVERGEPDPHREGCADCTRAHASRQELVETLPLVGASEAGDPHWQAKVWRRIDRERAPAPRRWRPQLAGLLAFACVVALWLGLGRSRNDAFGPRIAIVAQGEPTRSATDAARVGDRLQVTVGEGYAVWIYRETRLVAQCRTGRAAPGCAVSSDGLIADVVLPVPGLYVVLSVKSPPPALPHGVLDEDRGDLLSVGLSYQEDRVTVR